MMTNEEAKKKLQSIDDAISVAALHSDPLFIDAAKRLRNSVSVFPRGEDAQSESLAQSFFRWKSYLGDDVQTLNKYRSSLVKPRAYLKERRVLRQIKSYLRSKTSKDITSYVLG